MESARAVNSKMHSMHRSLSSLFLDILGRSMYMLCGSESPFGDKPSQAAMASSLVAISQKEGRIKAATSWSNHSVWG